MTHSYHIRTMQRNELELAINWAAEEGWNPGLHDIDSFFDTDPAGFFMGFLEGKPIASLSAIKYGNNFGFMGFYIVKPDYRNKGYGLPLWNIGLDYLKGRNIGLDGVVAQQDNYQKSGFSLAYRNIRYAGTGACQPLASSAIKPLSAFPFEAIAEYDQYFFPALRKVFLRSWIKQQGSIALGLEHNNQLAGMGVIRPCRSGYKIGPLYADTPAQADLLFSSLCSHTSTSDSVYLDIPELNSHAIDLVNKHAMQVVFETARMYNQGTPNLALNNLYGVTSFELG